MLSRDDQIIACYWMTGNVRETCDILDLPLRPTRERLRHLDVQLSNTGRKKQTRTTPIEKVCPKCKTLKPRNGFSRYAIRPDGLAWSCLTCEAERVKLALRVIPEANVQRVREWRIANPDHYRALSTKWRHTRQINLRAVVFEQVSYAYIYSRDRGMCHICGKKVPRKGGHLDHLIPLSLGGPTTVANIALAHARCNLKRGAGRTPAQLLMFG